LNFLQENEGRGFQMLILIGPTSAILSAIFAILLSKSKKNYQRLVENGGEKFAAQVTIYLRVGGVLFLVFSFIWLVVVLFT
jgi:isoprenylcysteine carboxyl methyltransferase (ICMT) family protein YpbQ